MTFKNRFAPLPVLFAACALLGSSIPASAADKLNYASFKAGLTITEALGPPATYACFAQAPDGGTAASGTITGSGLSTIGALAISSSDCITSASPYLLPPLTFGSQSVVLRAANGDTLTAVYEGTGTAQGPGVLVLSGTFTITGGTGQYLGAQGAGTIDGVEDISTNPARGFVVLSGRLGTPR